MKKYLFQLSQKYGFPILRPLQDAIRARGGEVAWFVDNPACREFLREDERKLMTVAEVMEYDPAAVFSTVHYTYDLFPGVKVQLFHGFSIDKRPGRSDGRYTIRGWFDLYCANDLVTIDNMTPLAVEYGSFRVAPTGWTKLDGFFTGGKLPGVPENQPPVILYSSTFTEGITSTGHLYQEIDRLAGARDWRWIITFHPMMAPDVVAKYKELAVRHSNVDFYEGDDNVGVLREADVMLCDSSSIIFEFMFLDKPVVTFRNTRPGEHLIDIDDPALLEGALEKALRRPEELMRNIREKMALMHPWRDGRSSERVLDAVDDFIAKDLGKLRKKKVSPVRKWKIKRKLKHIK